MIAERLRSYLAKASLIRTEDSLLSADVAEERRRIDYLQHLTWIMPTAAVILVMVEVYGVADFSVTTSLAILSSAGPTQVAAGAVLALLPYLLPIVALAAFWWGLRLRAVGANADHPLIAWAVAAAAILLSAWQNILVILGIAIAYLAALCVAAWMLGRAQRSRSAGEPRPLQFRAGPMLIVATLAVFLLTLTEPWVAPEVVTIRESPEVRSALEPSDGLVNSKIGLTGVAYPLEDGLTWDTFLIRKTRRVIRIRSEDVLSRNTCRYDLPQHHEALLHELLGHDDPPVNDECPTQAQLVAAAGA